MINEFLVRREGLRMENKKGRMDFRSFFVGGN
jgi:hypothetical protein